MKKLGRILSTVLCILAIHPLAACTDTGSQIFTIGILNPNPRQSLNQLLDAFQESMADLGYIEGETVVYTYQQPVGGSAELEQAAQMLVAAKVDLIFSLGTPATLAAQSAASGTNIPIIFAPLNDPVRSGIVKSLTHPGGNLTGIQTGGYVAKELEWLLTLAPRTQRIFVPYNPADDISVQSLALLRATAVRFRVTVLVREIRSAKDARWATRTIPVTADAILILPTALVLEQMHEFVDAASKRKLPLAVPMFPYVEAGGLVAYGANYAAIGRQVSRLADKIRQGVAPADLPVETAEFYLGINLQTAQTIGLEIPNALIQQANFIVH